MPQIITKDVAAVIYSGLTVSSLTLNITIGNNTGRILIIGVSTYKAGGTPPSISSVKIGSTNFTHLTGADGTSAVTNNVHTEIWYLIAPPTGPQTISVIAASTTDFITVGGLSVYNADQITGLQSGANNNGDNTGQLVQITPTVNGSWIFGHIASASHSTTTGDSHTMDWDDEHDQITNGQHNINPTIGVANPLSWTNLTAEWAASGAEVLAGKSFTFKLDTVLKSTKTITFKLDTVLKAIKTLTFKLDLESINRNKITFKLDTNLVNRHNVLFSLDTITKALKRTITFTLDTAITKLSKTKTFVTDLVISNRNTKTLDLDCVLKATNKTTFLLDMVIEGFKRTKTFTVGLVIFNRKTITFKLDLIVAGIVNPIRDTLQSKSVALDTLQSKSIVQDTLQSRSVVQDTLQAK